MIGVSARDNVGQSAPLLAYLLLVAVVAAIGGALPGLATAAFGRDEWRSSSRTAVTELAS